MAGISVKVAGESRKVTGIRFKVAGYTVKSGKIPHDVVRIYVKWARFQAKLENLDRDKSRVLDS